MIADADVMTMPMAANTVIVVGSATTCPTICSRCERPKRVKSGMLSDSVAQKPIIAVSDGTKMGRNDERSGNLLGWLKIVPSPCARQMAQPTRMAVMTSTYGAAQ